MDKCLFCKIAKKEIEAKTIYENDDALAFLDIVPRSPGHTMVVPKIHASSLSELPDEKLKPFFQAVKKTIEMIENGLGPDGFTMGINQGKASGQEVMHLHFHIIPRWMNDGGSSIQRAVDNPPKQTLDEIAKKITT